MNIYVSNISFKSTESDLRELFEEHGEVSSVKIILDKETQRSRGFGFVDMPDDAAAKQAISELNGYNLQGKDLTVNEARPKTDSPRGNYGNGGGSGFGNRSGGSGYGNRGGGNRSW
jgi:RNA recognition motif-containing protein